LLQGTEHTDQQKCKEVFTNSEMNDAERHYNNNNNNNNLSNVYGAVIMTKVITRVHLVHLINADSAV